jgi:NodT family efflux transporter outer membrane factor (OMF) lipoprotein
MTATSLHRSPSALFIALALAGCTVGPDYKGPPNAAPIAATAISFHRASAAPVTATHPVARWWEALNDPLLARLVDTALANSPTIKQAGARVMEARATVVERRAGLFPQGSASGLAAHTHFPTGNLSSLIGEAGASPGGSSGASQISVPYSIERNLYDAGFDASWELDLFGATRRGIENAWAQAEAQEAQLADAQVQLAAEVAQAYVNLRDVQRREALLRRSSEIEQHMLDLTRQRRALGTASQADVERLDTQLNQTLASIAPLEAQTDQYLDQIATLAALEPGQLDAALTRPGPVRVPVPPVSVAVGDPAAMLRRRPDIREAERQLAASNAQIGQAIAQFFPTVSLFGTVGFAGTEANHLFNHESFNYLGGPTLSWNVFNFGRTSARVREAEAENQAALAQYQSTVLSALQDAETALSRFGHQRDNVARLATAEASAARGAELTRQRQEAGTA